MSRSFASLNTRPKAVPPVSWQPDRLKPPPAPAKAEKASEAAVVVPGGEATGEAYRRGLDEGYRHCREELAAREEDLARREAALEQTRVELAAQARQQEERLQQERTVMMKGAQLQLVELSVRVAERLLRAQLKLSPDTVIRVAREALAQLEGGQAVRIRASEADLPVLLEAVGGLAAEAGVAELEVAAHPGLEQGELELETDSGSLDARWSSQLARMQRGLRQPLTGEEGA